MFADILPKFSSHSGRLVSYFKMSERRDSDRGRGRNSSGNNKLDTPKNSRLFVVASKNHTDDILREHFNQFEGLEDVWLVTDRRTGEKKGVAYVKFEKASQAGKAMEDTDGQVIGGIGRAVKVKVAQSRESGSTRDFDEDEELTRIFLVTPKTYKESDIREKFEEYGKIHKIHQLTDKKTGENKGFAYVKYYRMSEAALAIENSDPDFKAVWAEPRGRKGRDEPRRNHSDGDRRRDDSWERSRDRYDRGLDRDIRSRDRDYDSYEYSWKPPRTDFFQTGNSFTSASAGSGGSSFDEVLQQFSLGSVPSNATSRLQVDVTGKTTEQQLHALFNIIPCMEYCDFREEQSSWGFRGTAHVRYKSPAFAAYARLKLNGLEYPEGCPLMIQFMGAPEVSSHTSPPLMSTPSNLSSHSLISSAFSSNEPLACSVKLPPPQLLAPEHSDVKERLFVILTRPLPDQVVQDVFCRFGQLISYYNIKGRNYGYAKFADAECAKIAMETLHGQEVCGERMKVVIAEPENSTHNKRQRME